jgi:hypothetical protein
MTALPPPTPDGLAIIDLIQQECSRLDAVVIGGQRHAHHRPLIFHDPPRQPADVSPAPEARGDVLLDSDGVSSTGAQRTAVTSSVRSATKSGKPTTIT